MPFLFFFLFYMHTFLSHREALKQKRTFQKFVAYVIYVNEQTQTGPIGNTFVTIFKEIFLLIA